MLAAAYSRLDARGFSTVTGSDPDPVSRMVLDSALDALAAEQGALPLTPQAAQGSIRAIVADQPQAVAGFELQVNV